MVRHRGVQGDGGGALFDEPASELEEIDVAGRGSFVLAGDCSFPDLDRQVRLLPEYDP
jgi:hypothetical protein